MEHFSTATVSLVGVFLFMAFCRRFIRFNPPPYVTENTLETLRRKFQLWEGLSVVPVLLFTAVIGSPRTRPSGCWLDFTCGALAQACSWSGRRAGSGC